VRRFAYFVANLLGAVVLALLIVDPTRDLTIVFVLLAVAVALVLAARRMPSADTRERGE